MTPQEADEVFNLIVRIFPKVDAERAFRVRTRLLESGLIANTARELVFQHRDTHEYLTEPDLYTEVARVKNPAVDAAERRKTVARDVAERRKREMEEQKAVEASWEKVGAWLAKQPSEKVEAWKATALSGLPDFQRSRLLGKSFSESPMLSALIVGVAKAERAAVAT